MKEKFIISTTDNIEGGIEQYIDVICTNIVIGTNFSQTLLHLLLTSLEADLIHIEEN